MEVELKQRDAKTIELESAKRRLTSELGELKVFRFFLEIFELICVAKKLIFWTHFLTLSVFNKKYFLGKNSTATPRQYKV